MVFFESSLFASLDADLFFFSASAIRLKKPKEGKGDSSVIVDYTVIDELKSGGKVKGYKKGGPITYRMTGGQVVDAGYD